MLHSRLRSLPDPITSCRPELRHAFQHEPLRRPLLMARPIMNYRREKQYEPADRDASGRHEVIGSGSERNRLCSMGFQSLEC